MEEIEELIYASAYKVGESTVFMDENGIVVGVSIHEEFPSGVVIGEVYNPPPTEEERIEALENAVLGLMLGG
jgi:hypothetical protein